ncbi:YchJ family protein [Oerskovia flava]|uniref:YchJ family protein n=1 Tax=Oerskovia flava TaxID=2986422 RepID=UPI0022405237|nr:YchJ family protein [Oerskovia sp. JB1-3-2]
MTAARPLADDARCPCLSGDLYGVCCRRFVSRAKDAPTAEALMRSRYTAFVTGDADYLLASWHPSTRPERLDLDDDLVWRRLDILATEHGGPFDASGVVEFVAHYRDTAGGRGQLHEVSRFVRRDGRWFYLDASVLR